MIVTLGLCGDIQEELVTCKECYESSQ